ncbi:hypothetical protein MBANPS3_005176 [Mucor bainieri]
MINSIKHLYSSVARQNKPLMVANSSKIEMFTYFRPYLGLLMMDSPGKNIAHAVDTSKGTPNVGITPNIR